ncbi:hypothetical protein REPUB_Repub13aG0048900 [Reevesia pubescens]
MCDGWKGTTNQHIINFLIYSPRGTVFRKSIDSSNVKSRNAEYYFGLMDNMVEEIGEEFVVQVVTDNEVAVKAGGRELLRPGITRFATNFIALESILRSKQALKEMVTSEGWIRSMYARKPGGLEMMEVIDSKVFWSKAVEIQKVQEPLLKVLRMCDGDEKPTMGYIYEAIDRAKLAIKKDCRYYHRYWEIIDRRWSSQLHNDLHSAAEWWIHYGSCALELQRIAVRVLSQTTSSSNCERNWSTFSLIHTKKRNRLKHKKLQN